MLLDESYNEVAYTNRIEDVSDIYRFDGPSIDNVWNFSSDIIGSVDNIITSSLTNNTNNIIQKSSVNVTPIFYAIQNDTQVIKLKNEYLEIEDSYISSNIETNSDPQNILYI